VYKKHNGDALPKNYKFPTTSDMEKSAGNGRGVVFKNGQMMISGANDCKN